MEFNKALLDCMQALRRRLRDEQQLEIRLSQPDAIAAMLDACLVSDDELTRELGQQLAVHSGMVRTTAALPEHLERHERPVRIYRGQRIPA